VRDDIVSEAGSVDDDKISLIPRRVIAYVFGDEASNVTQLPVPQAELWQHPLPTQ